MKVQSAVSGFIDRLDGSVPDPALHFELVRGLYSATSTPKAMFSATFAALIVIATAGGLSGDAVYAALFMGLLVVGCARSAAVWLFGRAEHDPNDGVRVRRWEKAAMLGAWAFAGLVGLHRRLSLMFHAGTDTEILVNCCVIGYIAGVSSRNASRPMITDRPDQLHLHPVHAGAAAAGRHRPCRALDLHRLFSFSAPY